MKMRPHEQEITRLLDVLRLYPYGATVEQLKSVTYLEEKELKRSLRFALAYDFATLDSIYYIPTKKLIEQAAPVFA